MNTHAIVSDTHHGVLGPQTIISDVCHNVMNPHTIASDIHNTVVEGQEGTDSRDHLVSVACTLFAAESVLTIA